MTDPIAARGAQPGTEAAELRKRLDARDMSVAAITARHRPLVTMDPDFSLCEHCEFGDGTTYWPCDASVLAEARQQGRETLREALLDRWFEERAKLDDRPVEAGGLSGFERGMEHADRLFQAVIRAALAADPRPLHSDPEMQARCDGKCASDECVCSDQQGRETLDVATMSAALRKVPTIKYVVARGGRFNDAWWGRFAEEVLAALAADHRPETEGTEP